MTLMHYNPAKNIDTFSNVIDRFFDAPANCRAEGNCTWSPNVDVAEYEDRYEFVVEVPGLNRDDIKVSLEDNVLIIGGERKQENAEEEKHFHHVERYYGSFERSFRLPKDVKGEEVKAKYESGLLNIQVPKAEEAKPREISIN